jgi:general secretion pathway protein G
MYKTKYAFSLVELIFVIIILGILSAVAIPKLGGLKEEADLSKARSDVATIRSAILSERQEQIVKGNRSYIDKLTPNVGDNLLFTGNGSGRALLMYGIKKGEWDHTAAGEYELTIGSTVTTFDYNSSSGKFTCTSGDGYCDEIVD